MRSLLLLLLLLACAPDLGAPRRTGRSAAEVRVATWNVHDLFDSDDRLVPPGEVDAWGRPLWPRDCVELHVRTPGRPVVVVASHLSSALSDDGTRRALQAGRLRDIADGLRAARPTALVLAGGDLNDRPASAALAPLLEDGAWIDPAPPGVVTWTGASG